MGNGSIKRAKTRRSWGPMNELRQKEQPNVQKGIRPKPSATQTTEHEEKLVGPDS